MINKHHAVRSNLKLAILACFVLMLSACAGSGQYERPGLGAATPDNGFGVPSYVRNLPKSRSGNMAQYTVFGKQYQTLDSAQNFVEQGVASWYGKKFHGRKTSSGEIYDMHAMTAAHKHLPLPTFVRVTNLENNQSVVVKVNDRGPFVGDRIIDMSYTAAKLLGMVEKGTANVQVVALSTHFVDQEPPSASAMIANTGNTKGVAPPVLAPQVSAVPNQPILQAAQPVVPAADAYSAQQINESPANLLPIDTQAATSQAAATVQIDGSEDGFTESPELGAASVAQTNASVLSEPSEVQQMIGEPNATSSVVQSNGENVYIQLGAFSEANNAHAMVNDVDEQTGLPAYVERDSARKLFRVKMGPFKQGDILENTLQSLASVGIESYTKLAAK